MFLQYWTEFRSYALTEDFRREMYVMITWTITDILLASLLIPVVIAIYKRRKHLRIRVLASFFTLQYYHRVTRFLLRVGGVEDVRKGLAVEREGNRALILSARRFYGNLEEILFLAEQVTVDGRLKNAVEQATQKEIEKLHFEGNACLQELDHLILLLGGLSADQEHLLRLRFLLFALADELKASTENDENRKKVCEIAAEAIREVHAAFQTERKLTDAVDKSQHYKYIARVVCRLPYLIVRRRVVGGWCRFFDEPYLGDQFTRPYLATMIAEWRTTRGLSLGEAATRMGLPEKEYKEYEYNYRVPCGEKLEMIKRHLRGETDVAR